MVTANGLLACMAPDLQGRGEKGVVVAYEGEGGRHSIIRREGAAARSVGGRHHQQHDSFV